MKTTTLIGGILLLGAACLAASSRADDLPEAEKDLTGLQVGVFNANEPLAQTNEEAQLCLKPMRNRSQEKLFYLYVPQSYAASKPGPVVVILHPRGRPAQQMQPTQEDLHTYADDSLVPVSEQQRNSGTQEDLATYADESLEPWKKLAEKDNILLVLPVGDVDTFWGGVSWYTGDRPKLFEALLKEVAGTHAFDARRVYIVGNGEGGHVAVATAMGHGYFIAAVAACNPPLLDGKSDTKEIVYPKTVSEMLKDAGKIKPPMLILAGKEDEELELKTHHFLMGMDDARARYQDDGTIPLAHVEKMVALLKKGGVNVELRGIEGGHYNPLPDDQVPAVWEFLQKHSLAAKLAAK
jgi:poly(3-hydroxybutyrate) depolymerase